MMSLENREFEQSQLHESTDEMESLALNENDNSDEQIAKEIIHPLLLPSSSSSNSHNFPINSFLDPPSYADVIYSSFDESINGNGNIVESPRLPSRSDTIGSEYLKISVMDPQKEQELSNSLVPGGNTYFTYLINTSTNIIDFGGTEFIVRRRFKDVVTLADRLAEAHRGLFIPPRPDKNVVESQVMQKQEFVEQRRVALEKYLRRLAIHPVLRTSDEFRAFLRTDGKLPLPTSIDVASRMIDGAVRLPKQLFGGEPACALDLQEVVQPAKGGRDLLRMFRELKQSVTNDWGGVKPMVVEEDKEFMVKKEKMRDLEQHLNSISQQAEALVKSQQDMGETMGELGLAFVKMTKFETDEVFYSSQRVRGYDTKYVATTTVKSSRLYRELNAQTVKHLDKLHEYLGTMLAVNTAFSDRTNALLTVQTLVSDVSSLLTKIEKLEVASSKIFGGDKWRIRKMEELKETLKVTEDAKCCAVKEYERIKENNRSELERFDNERRRDSLNMLKGFVCNQVGYAEKMGEVWGKVADEMSRYAIKDDWKCSF